MHVTTMRFDDDTWATVRAEAERLGISGGEYVRGAVAHYVGYRSGLGARGELEARMDRLARALTQLAAHVRGREVSGAD